MKTIKELTITIAALCFVVALVWYCKEAHTEPAVETVYISDPNYVQNIYEAQERLKAQGLYKGRIDGKWGPLMDEAYCNWSAIQEFGRVEQ